MIKKKALKKFGIYSLVALLIASFLSTIYVYYPKLPDSIDNRLRDFLFNVRGEIPNTDTVIIIDIDEKSLKKLGQWPWERYKVAKILENLTQNDIGLIAFDIVFAEEDNSSPSKIFKEYNIQMDNVPNYDEQLARTVATTPTILGYLFELEKENYVGSDAPNIPAIFIEKNKPTNTNFLIKGKGAVLNVPIIQDNSYSSGFFNNIPDPSGIIRSVPLIISYNDMIFPSLSLEVLRVIYNTKRVFINYDEQGVESVSLNDVKIPTDRYGRVLVNFRGKERNFKYYSAIDIYENKIPKEKLEGKVALIGTSAAGLLDLRATPFESVYPGVEVHANVIDNVLKGDFIYKASWIDGANILMIFVFSYLLILLITYAPFWANPLITVVFLFGFFLFAYILMFDYGIVISLFFPMLSIILGAVIATLFDYFYEIKKEEAIKEKFASKVSKEVMENLLKNIDSNEFQAMEKEVTVFFSDVRGFTNISEQMGNAKNLISYLNHYMEPMSNIITKYQGTIDKYIGDAIMAYWNAPADVEDHADKAVTASLMQIKELEPLNKKYEEENKPFIDIGIGLNTGVAIVGEMGSSGRSDYTVIGDPINLGARLESLCKFYNSRLNISNFTKEQLKEQYIYRFLDLVRVKGKKEPVEIWQVIDFGEAKGELKEELELHHKAIELYKTSYFKEALELFENLEANENKTNNNIYKLYINRCKEFIKQPPENFDGVYEHTTKG